jgi:hypothetical protein
MSRSIVWTLRTLPIVAATLAAPAALAQEPPPAYPPGYPGAPGGAAPGQPMPGQPMPGQPGQPGTGDNPPEESEDSGLGLEWIWLNADAGFAYTDLASFSQSSLGMQKTASSGPVVGAGVGARLLFFTVGIRARDVILSSLGNLWEVGGEAAFHMRFGHVDPYFGVRGGYNWVGTLDQSTISNATGNTSPSVSVHGFNVGPMLGLDIYFAHWISVGADVDAQFLFLQRPQAPLPDGLTASQAISKVPPQYQGQASALYGQSGSSAGLQIAPTVHLGIHF